MAVTFASVFFSVCGVSNNDHLSFLLLVLHSSLAIFFFFFSSCTRSVTCGPIASIYLFEEPFAVKRIGGDVTVKGTFMRRGSPLQSALCVATKGLKKRWTPPRSRVTGKCPPMSDHLHALTHALNLILLANPSLVVSVSLSHLIQWTFDIFLAACGVAVL